MGYVATQPTSDIPNQGKTTVGSSSTSVLAENEKRQQLWLSNTSDEPISIRFGEDAVLNEGIVIAAGTGIVIDTFLSTLEMNAICASGGKNLAFCEVNT
jgi:hypothetical protein